MSRPKLVGIVNLTPDSFSGDGRSGGDAINHAMSLVESGADLLDIGAESTRPGATPLTAEEEWARLSPFLENYRGKAKLSIDTYHPANAAKLSAHIINDVSGLRDPEMLKVAAGQKNDIIVMHSLTVPADKAVVWPNDVNPVAEILKWKSEVIDCACAVRIKPERLIFDPGLGFGKTPEQSLALALAARDLVASGGRWLIGHSRKSFLSLFSDAPASDRDALTLMFSTLLANAGIHYLRVHNVEAHRKLFERLCI